MALLTRDERRHLIDLLMNLPGMGDPDARGLLLMDLPRSLRESMNPEDYTRIYLTSLVNNIESDTWEAPIDGNWPLVMLLENAIDAAQDTAVGQQLRPVLDTVRARIAQGTTLPAPPPPDATPDAGRPPARAAAADPS